jgi:hypothetical protein
MRRLELLADREGLSLGTAARVVVAGEGKEDNEPERDREPGGQHPEAARGAVAVGKTLPSGARRRTRSIARTATAVATPMIRSATIGLIALCSCRRFG